MTETAIKTYQELEDENYELQRQKKELIDLLEKACDWDWLSAKEEAEDSNQDFFEIPEMDYIFEKLKAYKED